MALAAMLLPVVWILQILMFNLPETELNTAVGEGRTFQAAGQTAKCNIQGPVERSEGKCSERIAALVCIGAWSEEKFITRDELPFAKDSGYAFGCSHSVPNAERCTNIHGSWQSNVS